MTAYLVTDNETGVVHDVEAATHPAAARHVANREFPFCGIWRSLGTPPGDGVFDAYSKTEPEVLLSKNRYHVEEKS